MAIKLELRGLTASEERLTIELPDEVDGIFRCSNCRRGTERVQIVLGELKLSSGENEVLLKLEDICSCGKDARPVYTRSR